MVFLRLYILKGCRCYTIRMKSKGSNTQVKKLRSIVKSRIDSVSRAGKRLYQGKQKKVMLAIAIFLALSAALVLLQPALSHMFTNRQSELLLSQSYTLNSLNSIPSPEIMQIGQRNADARTVANRTSKQVGNMIKISTTMDVPRYYSGMAWLSTQARPSDIRSVRQSIDRSDKAIQDTMKNYDRLVGALLLFIEYSPAVDMSEYDPGSDDIAQRMDRLESGLSDTLEKLSSIETEAAANSKSLIKQAQDLQRSLEDSNDVDVFINQFEPLQNQAKELLIVEHEAIQSEIRSKLLSQTRQIQRVF